MSSQITAWNIPRAYIVSHDYVLSTKLSPCILWTVEKHVVYIFEDAQQFPITASLRFCHHRSSFRVLYTIKQDIV